MKPLECLLWLKYPDLSDVTVSSILVVGQHHYLKEESLHWPGKVSEGKSNQEDHFNCLCV